MTSWSENWYTSTTHQFTLHTVKATCIQGPHATAIEQSVDHLSGTNTPLYKDHLSTETTVGWSMDHLSGTNTPLYKDHTETTVGWSMDHLSGTNTPLYKDHLSTETTIARLYSGLYRLASWWQIDINVISIG